MTKRTHSLDSSLLVRDVTGDYRPANADEVLQAARRVLAEQMRGCEVLSSPQVVRDYLRVKLGTLEHEVFALIHLDSQTLAGRSPTTTAAHRQTIHHAEF